MLYRNSIGAWLLELSEISAIIERRGMTQMGKFVRFGVVAVAGLLVTGTVALAKDKGKMEGVGYGENIGTAKEQARGALTNIADVWGIGYKVTVSVKEVECKKVSDMYKCEAEGKVSKKSY
jgi:hypothetical protein